MFSSLYTVYQPIRFLHNLDIFGYESLLRGDRAIGMIFKEAKRRKKLRELDIYAQRLAINTFAADWANNMPRTSPKLFINSLPVTLMYHHEHFWEKAKIPLHQLVLEITENEVLKNGKEVKQLLDPFRKQGGKVAIDDFGTGFANFKLVEILEPDYIKISKQITKNVVHSNQARSVVMGLRTFASEIQAEVIAEGIETSMQYEVLRSCGIFLGQGWYLGKPSRTFEKVDITYTKNKIGSLD